MHPLLKSWKHLLQYLGYWIALGAVLGFMLAVSGRLSLAETAAVTVPITAVLAAVCLSAWFVARSSPRRSTAGWKMGIRQGVAAMCASALVLVFAHYLVFALSRAFPGLDTRFATAARFWA